MQEEATSPGPLSPDRESGLLLLSSARQSPWVSFPRTV